MPKKQKRFKSEQAILEAIDAQDKKQKEKYAEADQLLANAMAMVLKPGVHKQAEIQWQRTLAGRACRSAERAASKKAELGKALSAMRTPLLPMPNNEDTSVTI